MIQLFISNCECVIPNDFSFTMIEDNAEITKNGEFTLDLTLSLLEAKNAIAFKFLNRLNVSSINITTDATMIIDGKFKYGKIIIISNTDISVTFQFVSGNSELNYTVKNDARKIWELDWGVETTIDYARALESLSEPGYYYEEIWGRPPTIIKRYFVCTPVQVGEDIANDYTVRDATSDVPCIINGVNDIIMQPYLLYYINKLPELLGYKLTTNILNDDVRAKYMYLVNAVNSLKYSDALPDMSIAEFIEAIENFFNISFVVNGSDKTISIIRLESNIANKKIVEIKDILDSYERTITEESKDIRFDFTRITYDLPKSGLLLYQKLDDEIANRCEVIEIQNETDLKNRTYYLNHYGNFKFYRDLSKNYDYILCGAPLENVFYHITNISPFNIYLVNKLKPYGTTDEKEISLKIVPAEIFQAIKNVKFVEEMGADADSDLSYSLPKSSIASIVNPLNQNILEVIENETNISRTKNVEVSLYMGKIQLLNLFDDRYDEMNNVQYPFSYIDFYPEYGFQGWTTGAYADNWDRWYTWINTVFLPKALTTMRLVGDNSVIADYRQEPIIDTSKEYSFTVFDSSDVSANNLFFIENQKYMPISFERKKSNKESTVLGKFYRML